MLIQSPIHQLHASRDAFFLPYGPEGSQALVVETFGDLDMEYAAIRKGVVLFDSPHMGTLRITGADRRTFLNNMISSKVMKLEPGHTQGCFWLNRKGRIDADLLLCEFADHMLIRVDRHLAASTADALNAFIFSEDAEIRDISEETHRMSLHGPNALSALRSASQNPDLDLAEGECIELMIKEKKIHANREDLTGEIGIELVCTKGDVLSVHADLLRTGETNPVIRLRETGWLAINAARIESGHPLFNIDFGASNVPAESGIIEDRVSYDKGCYLGQEVVARMHARNIRKQTIVALRIEDQRITTTNTEVHQPVAGAQVFPNETPLKDPIGSVTSSTISPMLGAIPICFAMVKDAFSAPGTELRVIAEGATVNAIVEPELAFYTRPGDRRR